MADLFGFQFWLEILFHFFFLSFHLPSLLSITCQFVYFSFRFTIHANEWVQREEAHIDFSLREGNVRPMKGKVKEMKGTQAKWKAMKENARKWKGHERNWKENERDWKKNEFKNNYEELSIFLAGSSQAFVVENVFTESSGNWRELRCHLRLVNNCK